MGWKIKSLKNILDIEGTVGAKVKYKGYTEALLEIPQIKNFEEPSLFVVIMIVNMETGASPNRDGSHRYNFGKGYKRGTSLDG